MNAFHKIPFGWYFKKGTFSHRRDGGFDKIDGGWNLMGLGQSREALSGIFGELV
jgi:hypothetical protein